MGQRIVTVTKPNKDGWIQITVLLKHDAQFEYDQKMIRLTVDEFMELGNAVSTGGIATIVNETKGKEE